MKTQAKKTLTENDTVTIYMDACNEAARYAEQQLELGDQERAIRAMQAVLNLTIMAIELLNRRKRKGDKEATASLMNLSPTVEIYAKALNRARRGKLKLALVGTTGRE